MLDEPVLKIFSVVSEVNISFCPREYLLSRLENPLLLFHNARTITVTFKSHLYEYDGLETFLNKIVLGLVPQESMPLLHLNCLNFGDTRYDDEAVHVMLDSVKDTIESVSIQRQAFGLSLSTVHSIGTTGRQSQSRWYGHVEIGTALCVTEVKVPSNT